MAAKAGKAQVMAKSKQIVIKVVKKPLDFSKGFLKQCNKFTH